MTVYGVLEKQTGVYMNNGARSSPADGAAGAVTLASARGGERDRPAASGRGEQVLW
ncbi:hypothetical protein G3I70_28030, partial [Actinomadura bangladeshensis]|nr:hypothetical protein [Actinomadura bangladeshensis]